MGNANRYLFWIPRIFLILFALFLSIFSLDVFGNDYTLVETVVGLFMHNIPSLILLAILLVSWRHDLVGGIIFITLGIACVIGTVVTLLTISAGRNISPLIKGGMINPMLIVGSVVFTLIGILFMLGWRQGKSHGQKKHKK
jgi:hypothetical protein